MPPERELFKRRRKKVNYREEEDLDDDDYICELCLANVIHIYRALAVLSEVLVGQGCVDSLWL